MIEDADFQELVDPAAQLVHLAGVAVIVFGLLFAAGLLGRGIAPAGDRQLAYRQHRQRVGKAILLGLEFLVAADIIRTVAVTPTLRLQNRRMGGCPA